MYDLIKTVEHQYEDGSKSLLKVSAMKTEQDEKTGAPGFATIASEYGDNSIIVNTIDQANRLHKALVAALVAAGHEN